MAQNIAMTDHFHITLTRLYTFFQVLSIEAVQLLR